MEASSFSTLESQQLEVYGEGFLMPTISLNRLLFRIRINITKFMLA